MVVQASTQKCFCGKDITFPDGQIRTKCQYKYCCATWEIGEEGCWAIIGVKYAPSFAKTKERRKENYESKMKRRGVKK